MNPKSLQVFLTASVVAAGVLMFSMPKDFGEAECVETDYYKHCHPPKEICSTEWVVVYNSAGFFASDCINGEVNQRKLNNYMEDLLEQCNATSTCEWPAKG